MLTIGVVTSHPKTQSRVAVPNAIVLERHAPRRNREEFDRETASMLAQHDVDLVVLIGYLYIVTRPLLRAFRRRMLNIHDGTAKYPGLHATRDAIVAGERETFSMVHVVTEELDRGPVVAMSEAFPVAPFVQRAVSAGETDIVRAYAYAQREWMIRSSWSALVARALDAMVVRAVA